MLKRSVEGQNIVSNNFLCFLIKFQEELIKQMKEWEKVVVGPFSWQEAIKKDNGSSSKSKDVREDESMAFTKRLGETHLIVAALVATVSCAAGFTLPGGYNDSDGKAKLTENLAFKAFIMMDTLAVVLSVSAVLVYFVMSLHKDEDILAKQLLWGVSLTMLSVVVMVVAFVTGLVVVLPFDSLLWFVVCMLGGLYIPFVTSPQLTLFGSDFKKCF